MSEKASTDVLFAREKIDYLCNKYKSGVSGFHYSNNASIAKAFHYSPGFISGAREVKLSSSKSRLPNAIQNSFQFAMALHYGFAPVKPFLEDGNYDLVAWDDWFTSDFNTWRNGTLGDFQTALNQLTDRNCLPMSHDHMKKALQVIKYSKQKKASPAGTAAAAENTSAEASVVKTFSTALSKLASMTLETAGMDNVDPNNTPLLMGFQRKIHVHELDDDSIYQMSIRNMRLYYDGDQPLKSPKGWVNGKAELVKIDGSDAMIEYQSSGNSTQQEWKVEFNNDDSFTENLGSFDAMAYEHLTVSATVYARDVHVKLSTDQEFKSNRAFVIRFLLATTAGATEPERNTEILVTERGLRKR